MNNNNSRGISKKCIECDPLNILETYKYDILEKILINLNIDMNMENNIEKNIDFFKNYIELYNININYIYINTKNKSSLLIYLSEIQLYDVIYHILDIYKYDINVNFQDINGDTLLMHILMDLGRSKLEKFEEKQIKIINKLVEKYDLNLNLLNNYKHNVYFFISVNSKLINKYNDIIIKLLDKNNNEGWIFINNQQMINNYYFVHEIIKYFDFKKSDENGTDFLYLIIDKSKDEIIANIHIIDSINNIEIMISHYLYDKIVRKLRIFFINKYEISNIHIEDQEKNIIDFFKTNEIKNLLKIIYTIKHKLNKSTNKEIYNNFIKNTLKSINTLFRSLLYEGYENMCLNNYSKSEKYGVNYDKKNKRINKIIKEINETETKIIEDFLNICDSNSKSAAKQASMSDFNDQN